MYVEVFMAKASPKDSSKMIQSKSVLKNAALCVFYTILILNRLNLSNGYCPDGWMKHGRKCFGAFMPDGRYSFMLSMQYAFCTGNGGKVLQPKTAEENQAAAKFLNSRSPLHAMNALIGLNDRDREGHFKWGDGTKPTWQKWEAGEPNDDFGVEDCVEILGTGEWNDRSCKGECNDRTCENDDMYTYFTLCEQQLKGIEVLMDLQLNDVMRRVIKIGTCPSGWIRHDRKCYIAFPPASQWNSLQKMEMHCDAHNGVIMNTKTEEENHIAVKLMHSIPSWIIGRAVIGLKYQGPKDVRRFKWGDGTELTWENWYEGQLRHSADAARSNEGSLGYSEECVYLRGDGKWRDMKCTEDSLYSFITLCEQPRTASGNCPTGWTEFGPKCYAGFPPQSGLNDVAEMEKRHCISNNGMLMNPKTKEENDFALSLVNSVLANGKYSGLIGLRRRGKSTFKWYDGTSIGTYENWEKGSLQGNCAEMLPNGRWNRCACDDDDMYRRITLCEKPAKEELVTAATTPEAESPSPLQTTPTLTVQEKHPRTSTSQKRYRSVKMAQQLSTGIYHVDSPTFERRVHSITFCVRECEKVTNCDYINFNPSTGQCVGYGRDEVRGAEYEDVPGWQIWTFVLTTDED